MINKDYLPEEVWFSQLSPIPNERTPQQLKLFKVLKDRTPFRWDDALTIEHTDYWSNPFINEAIKVARERGFELAYIHDEIALYLIAWRTE